MSEVVSVKRTVSGKMDMNFKWHTRAEKLLVADYWWNEQRGLCCLCGDLMKPYSRQHTTDPDAATFEHLIPKRDSGPDTVGNVRLAHATCNNALGAHWERNRQRALAGLPLIPENNALRTAIGIRRKRLDQSDQPPAAQSFVPLDKRLVSLPRGATLLPTYKGHMGNVPRAPKQKTTAIETARWLTQQGIRGA
jgi:hypothetical protein